MTDVESVLSIMESVCSGKSSDLDLMEKRFLSYMENDEKYKIKYSGELAKTGMMILRASVDYIWEYQLQYYMMSFLLQATNNRDVYRALVLAIKNDSVLTKENKYHLMWQLNAYNFLHVGIMDQVIHDLMDDLYGDIFEAYKKDTVQGYSLIPKEERNPDFIMVFISQVLSIYHAPTKIMLEHCYLIEKRMKKKVFIVNTAELLSPYGSVLYFGESISNYEEQYSKVQKVQYKDAEFDFFQCPREMPDVNVIKEIVDVVESEKPYFIVSIGNNLVSDLCSNVVPTVVIPTTTGRVLTYGQFQTTTVEPTEEDTAWINKHHLPDEHMIKVGTSYVFEQPKHTFSRGELKLPDGQFIVVVVGNRLDAEVDGECLDMLQRLMEQGVFIAFVGTFGKYEQIRNREQMFQKQSIFLGYQDDLPAIFDCCNLYINPKRIGGGTSGAMALFRGVPVVTFGFGDVANAVGSQFHVNSYEEMYEQVVHYASDPAFYEEMSERAKQRADELMNGEDEFAKIVQKMEQSKYF